MKKKYKKRTKEYTKEEKKYLKELHYYKLQRPKYISTQYNIDKDLVIYFVNEYKQKQEEQIRFNNNHLNSEDFLKHRY
jgi:hypothetical protein